MCAVEMKKDSLRTFAGRGYNIAPHPKHQRLYSIQLEEEVVTQFLNEVQDISVEQLEYIPYQRLIVADALMQLLDEDFQTLVCTMLHDRNSGGFTIGLQGRTSSTEDYVKFSTALSHLAGVPNFDAMSKKYYARFSVKHTDDSDSYLRQAYRRFTLHTDGTYVDEPTDWLLMMKMEEENAVGGSSRLLHLDDWEDFDYFYNQPLGKHPFVYKAPASKNVSEEVTRKTFYMWNNKPCICFIDQFVYPETMQEAQYLSQLSRSMENSAGVLELELPVGDLVMLNNRFWLHGRAGFERNESLHRELLRQRGRFLQ
ncbi:glutarate dioxygenase GlaH [Halobacillus sp. ACCC02827]|uniref:glutarate dioxygenase GlaH n=1 Tax=Bacillaceae TaxID=186817 RepID=UPI00041E4521|nr:MULTISPECIES: glutarate dioxygenase GlaH [Bacillaceae]QHT47735.1 carbon starvation induced protein CsiD [Bacillus sp. SB49]WJE14975.1 glutarate dioxygenase GlaH [Halobacillus sp. ACCC02827]